MAVTGWTDSHCHVHDEEDASVKLTAAAAAGVERVVVVGTSLESSRRRALECASRPVPGVEVWATVGLHPHDALDGTAGLQSLLEAGHGGRVVAVGECGLDYYYDNSPRPAQREVFAAQIAMAHESGLALVVHTRDAWDDTFDVLSSESVPPRTVIHCFSGGPGEAERALALGCFLSFSGIVTFKNADGVRAAGCLCPDDRILVETDAPYLAPVPHRGRPNEPALVVVVGSAIAELRGADVAHVASLTSANAARVFGLDP